MPAGRSTVGCNRNGNAFGHHLQNRRGSARRRMSDMRSRLGQDIDFLMRNAPAMLQMHIGAEDSIFLVLECHTDLPGKGVSMDAHAPFTGRFTYKPRLHPVAL